jgi:hypothetical protein
MPLSRDDDNEDLVDAVALIEEGRGRGRRRDAPASVAGNRETVLVLQVPTNDPHTISSLTAPSLESSSHWPLTNKKKTKRASYGNKDDGTEEDDDRPTSARRKPIEPPPPPSAPPSSPPASRPVVLRRPPGCHSFAAEKDHHPHHDEADMAAGEKDGTTTTVYHLPSREEEEQRKGGGDAVHHVPVVPPSPADWVFNKDGKWQESSSTPTRPHGQQRWRYWAVIAAVVVVLLLVVVVLVGVICGTGKCTRTPPTNTTEIDADVSPPTTAPREVVLSPTPRPTSLTPTPLTTIPPTPLTTIPPTTIVPTTTPPATTTPPQTPLLLDFTALYQSHAYAISIDAYSADAAVELFGNNIAVCGRPVRLAAITSAGENDIITALGQNRTSNRGEYLFLGGFQDRSIVETAVGDYVRGWLWSTEEGSFPAGNLTTGFDQSYANWAVNEPDQRGGDDEDCLAIYTADGLWHDRRCGDLLRIIVEVDLDQNKSLSIEGCTLSSNIPDPLVSVVVRSDVTTDDDPYVCTYLSDAIKSLVLDAATSIDNATNLRSRLTSILDQLSDTLTPDMITIILDCVDVKPPTVSLPFP